MPFFLAPLTVSVTIFPRFVIKFVGDDNGRLSVTILAITGWCAIMFRWTSLSWVAGHLLQSFRVKSPDYRCRLSVNRAFMVLSQQIGKGFIGAPRLITRPTVLRWQLLIMSFVIFLLRIFHTVLCVDFKIFLNHFQHLHVALGFYAP